MRDRIPLIAVWSAIVLAVHAWAGLGASQPVVRTIGWQDVAPVQHRLESHGVTAATFASYVERVRQVNARRVREGDLDHLVFYLLQSTHFATLPPIEPALSAKALVEGLSAPARDAFLRDPGTAIAQVLPAVRSRVAALLRALDAPGGDARLQYFRELVNAVYPHRRDREETLTREYLRVMKFLYEKEFVAQRSPDKAAAVAELYRTRGLSTDTAVEAGFLVHQGLGVLKSLDPQRRVRRVLVVGPGLDLAPRTGLLEAGAPESYQPWAVIDALLALGLSRADDLAVVGGDINPRVVQHLRRARGRARTVTFVTGIAETDGVSFSQNYREYFTQLGRYLENQSLRRDRKAGERSEPASAKRDRERSERKAPGGGAPGALRNADSVGHIANAVRVDPKIARILDAERIDIVTERLTATPFDLIVATNIFPYFDDVELALALTNITSMLAPGGLFLHNENRPVMEELTTALGLRLEQSRHAVIATVRGAPPLTDSVWLHRKLGVRGSGLGVRDSGLGVRGSGLEARANGARRSAPGAQETP